MSGFNIRSAIREALRNSEEPDPRVVAKRLVPRIPRTQRDAILGDLLADAVRLEAGRMRAAVIPDDERADRKSAPRSRWARYVHQRICVEGTWKLLGDCSADDLDAVADEREAEAEALLNVAKRYRDIATRMRSAGARVAAELAPEDLQELAA